MEMIQNNTILQEIKQLLIASKTYISQTINTTIVKTYWHIGKIIVEDEQQGKQRAKYGAKQLKYISDELTKEFGRGYDVSNLRRMRKFYITFPIQDSVSPKLSWTHYRRLLRVENDTARQWYIDETISNNWSARALDRQISNLYYERLLSSQDKQSVVTEAQQNTKPLQNDSI